MDTESETEEVNEIDLLNGRSKDRAKVRIQSPKSDIKPRPDSLPPIELNEYKWDRSDSTPTGSFKKKFVFTVPGVMKQKQPREYKLKAFVIFIFFLIIIYLSLTYVFHKQQELYILQAFCIYFLFCLSFIVINFNICDYETGLETEISEGIHFHDKSRILRILNSHRHDVLKIQVGRYLPSDLIPYECDVEDIVFSKCFLWKNTAQLTIRRHLDSNNSNITLSRCYDIMWKSLIANFPICDCFNFDDGKWFGLGDISENPWPIDFHTKFTFVPFVTGDEKSKLGSILNRYLLSSKGVSVSVDSEVPLFISLVENVLCLKSEIAWPFTVVSNMSLDMHYSVCSGPDIRSIHEHSINELRPKSKPVRDLKLTLSQTLWAPNEKNANDSDTLMRYLDDVMQVEATNSVLVISKWQKEDGDLTFDPIRFPNFMDILEAIRLKTFEIGLEVHPYFSTSSSNYMKHLNFWISDEKNTVPALTKWNHISSAAILDFSNPEATNWFVNQLKNLPVTNLYFLGGQTTYLPFRYKLFDSSFRPDSLTETYSSKVSEISQQMNVASTFRPEINYLRVSPRTATWDRDRGLKSVLPLILNLGIAGFPFVNPGTVGGDDDVPSSELYIRWLQLSTFLPVLQLSHSPKALGEECFEETKKLLELRNRLVVPLLQELVEDAVNKGIPLIRPLWWVAPNDSVAMEIDSEFLVGDDLLVAPVLDAGSQFRDIYLPQGIWNYSGRLRGGPAWLRHEKVSLNQVPYFKRIIL